MERMPEGGQFPRRLRRRDSAISGSPETHYNAREQRGLSVAFLMGSSMRKSLYSRISLGGVLLALSWACLFLSFTVDSEAARRRAPGDIQVPVSLDFGTVQLPGTVTLQVQIDNLGAGPLVVSEITSDEPAFVPEPPELPFAIGAGGFEILDIEFVPPVAGSFNGTLTIRSSDPDEPLVTVPLFGTGVEAPVEIFLAPESIGIGVGGDPGGLTTFYLFGDGSVEEATAAAANLPAFSSNNTGVVSVAADGTLTALSQGSAIITASFGALNAQATVTVTAASTVNAVALSPDDPLTLEEGVTLQFTANAIPLSDNVDVVSSSPSVLSVDSVTGNGSFVTADVRGVSPGQADLMFRSQDDLDVFDVLRIHVVELTSLAIDPSPLTFPVAGVQALEAQALGTDGTYAFAFPVPDAQWSSDASGVAPVFPNGTAVGLAVGSATVTAQSPSNPALQGTVPVTVTSASGLPAAMLSGLAGEDIVANGVNVGTVIYGWSSQGGGTIKSAPSVERVFIAENAAAATAPLQVVFVETDTDRLLGSAPSGPIEPGRIGGLQMEVTLPDALIGTSESNLGPSTGTLTVYTNDPSNHQLDIGVTWTWQAQSGAQADASTTMFIDFGNVPDAAIRDRTFVFDLGQAGDRVTGVTVNNLIGSAFSLIANPNPFMADAFPETQTNAEVPLTFTLRAMPNATSGTFVGTVAFANDDVDEPVIEALVAVYGAPPHVPLLPADLTWAGLSDSTLTMLDGSERTLLPIPSGNDGLAYDQATGSGYLLSGSSFVADPSAGANDFAARMFKAPPTGRPFKIPAALSEDMVGLGANFSQNRAYAIDLGGPADDLVRITDAGSVSIVASGATISSRVGVDGSGNIYTSRMIANSTIALRKYSDAGSELAVFPGSSGIRDFDVANVSGTDRIYTDLGTKLDTTGVLLGTFTIIPDLEWFTVESAGKILSGQAGSSSTDPSSLTLEDPGGLLQDAGTLPKRALQGAF
jgi:uncharacterized protein YjdB